jgi:hypothetical protein
MVELLKLQVIGTDGPAESAAKQKTSCGIRDRDKVAFRLYSSHIKQYYTKFIVLIDKCPHDKIYSHMPHYYII